MLSVEGDEMCWIFSTVWFVCSWQEPAEEEKSFLLLSCAQMKYWSSCSMVWCQFIIFPSIFFRSRSMRMPRFVWESLITVFSRTFPFVRLLTSLINVRSSTSTELWILIDAVHFDQYRRFDPINRRHTLIFKANHYLSCPASAQTAEQTKSKQTLETILAVLGSLTCLFFLSVVQCYIPTRTWCDDE